MVEKSTEKPKRKWVIRTEVPKKAIRDGNKIIVDLLTRPEKKHHLQRVKIRKRRKKRVSCETFDKEIHPEKWYPGTYNDDDHLVIMPQGWWYLETAEEWWRIRLGLYNIRSAIHFIQGKEVIEKNYLVRKICFYNGQKIFIRSKIMFPVEVKISHNRKSFKQYLKKVAGCKGSTKATEKKFYNILFGLLPKIYMPKHKIKYIRREKYAQNKIRLQRLKEKRNGK